MGWEGDESPGGWRGGSSALDTAHAASIARGARLKTSAERGTHSDLAVAAARGLVLEALFFEELLLANSKGKLVVAVTAREHLVALFHCLALADHSASVRFIDAIRPTLPKSQHSVSSTRAAWPVPLGGLSA